MKHPFKVNADGRITIPAPLRRELDIRPGDNAELEYIGDGAFLVHIIRRNRNAPK